MKIKAAVANQNGGAFKLMDVELDTPRDDEILVKIAAVGLCHTDIVAQHGAFNFGRPAVLGHEGAGIVEQTGKSVTKVAPGDRVALSFRSCGACAKCNTGHPAYCHSMPLLNYAGMRTDGSRAIRCDGEEIASNFFGQSSFATHALTYEQNVVKIPDDLPFEIAAPLGCGIQTGAGSIINSLKCAAGSSLLVTGGGVVGLSAVMAGVLRGGATIIVLEPHQSRRDMALKLGATHVINPMEDADLAAAVRKISPLGVDYAFDTTGRQDVLDAIMHALAPQGILGCVGIGTPETKLPGNLIQAMTFGHTVMGIVEGDSDPSRFIPELITYYRDGRLPLDQLIKTYKFADINEAIADQHAGKCIKVVLTFD